MSSIFLFFLNVSGKNLASILNYERGLKRNKRLKMIVYQSQVLFNNGFAHLFST